MRNFLVYAPAYSEKYGGIISLHKLCDLINRSGGNAYLHPFLDLIEVNAVNIEEGIRHSQAQWNEYNYFVANGFPVRNDLITPVKHIFEDLEYGDDWIVVYPEITFGNPLRAKNVVRWLLHNPGFHSGRINYGANELHVPHNSNFGGFHYPGSKLSRNELQVVDFDLNLFSLDGVARDRSGSAYSLRKGAGKPIEHDLSTSILIDEKDLAEIAEIFKKVSVFYSYDTHSSYSQLAVLCGCDSVVIPDFGVPEQQWRPEAIKRNGIAYGIENIQKARETAHLVRPYFEELNRRSAEQVVSFMKEANDFFG